MKTSIDRFIINSSLLIAALVVVLLQGCGPATTPSATAVPEPQASESAESDYSQAADDTDEEDVGMSVSGSLGVQ